MSILLLIGLLITCMYISDLPPEKKTEMAPMDFEGI